MVKRLGCLLGLEGNKSSDNQGLLSSLPMWVASSMSLPKCRREKLCQLHHLAMLQTCQASPSPWPVWRANPGRRLCWPPSPPSCPLPPPGRRSSGSTGCRTRSRWSATTAHPGTLHWNSRYCTLEHQVLYTGTPGTVHCNSRYCTLEHQVLNTGTQGSVCWNTRYCKLELQVQCNSRYCII